MSFGIGDLSMLIQTLNSSSFRKDVPKLKLELLDLLINKLKLMINDGIQVHELDSLKNVLKEIGDMGFGLEIKAAVDKLIKKIDTIKLELKKITDKLSDAGIPPSEISGTSLTDLLQKVLDLVDSLDEDNDILNEPFGFATVSNNNILAENTFHKKQTQSPTITTKKEDISLRITSLKKIEEEFILDLYSLARDLLLSNIIDKTTDLLQGNFPSNRSIKKDSV